MQSMQSMEMTMSVGGKTGIFSDSVHRIFVKTIIVMTVAR